MEQYNVHANKVSVTFIDACTHSLHIQNPILIAYMIPIFKIPIIFKNVPLKLVFSVKCGKAAT